MKITYLFFIALLMFTSCKKQKIQSFFGRETDIMTPKALRTHPLDFCNDGNPVGGGSGYQSMINSAQANVVISSNMLAADFKLLIESSANKTIFINSNVVIDLTNLTQTIFLPQNIVIASDRGVGGSSGAMIKTDMNCSYYGGCSYANEVFTSNGNNIRITGLRLIGPYSAQGEIIEAQFNRAGIMMKGHDGLEVDNCELAAWPYAAIQIGALGSGNQFESNNNNKIQNGALYVMPYEITNGLTQGWTKILTTEYLMNQLRFGHYNSDNKTDVIVKDGDNIYVSYGCNTSWTLLNSTIYPLSSIHSGDLTGDGIQDFFCAYGGLWMIIDNANPNSNWITIANRNENSNVLKLGWFDLNTTNNKIDVFLANGVNFLSAYDGTQGWWTHLTGSTYLPPSLYICDFNSDGVSDVVNSSLRQVSLKGRDAWANCTTNNFPLSTFPYGDFN